MAKRDLAGAPPGAGRDASGSTGAPQTEDGRYRFDSGRSGDDTLRMRRFRAPNRLVVALVLAALLPLRAVAGGLLLPGQPETGMDHPPAVAATVHDAAGCCQNDPDTGPDSEPGTCAASCACCAVIASVAAGRATTLSPPTPTHAFPLTGTPHPVPLRPPRRLQS